MTTRLAFSTGEASARRGGGSSTVAASPRFAGSVSLCTSIAKSSILQDNDPTHTLGRVCTCIRATSASPLCNHAAYH
jgi:hypothetical protein